MQFAIVEDNPKAVPVKGLKGACPSCGSAMIAKCGEHKVHHWAHRGVRSCDPWWETETQWHRDWKNLFPPGWQEVIAHDEGGEKHIADVRTEHGLVVEFQHSHLDPDEQRAREAFYGNMIWIVDGTRLKRDFPRFSESADWFRKTTHEHVFLAAEPEKVFPKNWLACSAPVFFDFKVNGDPPTGDQKREFLWCLLPARAEGMAVVGRQSRAALVQSALTKDQIVNAAAIVEGLARSIRQERENGARLARQRSAQFMRSLAPYGRRRGWL